jgi:CubicO group peptidase (beta-lactamase class C family)
MTAPVPAVRDAVASASAKLVGLAVTAVGAGETAHASRGRADEEGRRPVDEHTVFEIGSVTKVFTALLLAVMVEAGDVALDEPLGDLYPELTLPVRGRPVTLVDLATHAAGLPRLPPGLLRQGLRHRDDPYASFSDADVARALESVRLRAEPGTRVRYSNFGAGVLGQALARRAGTPYDDLVRARVCLPLGMTDTGVRRSPDQLARRAVGHDRRGRAVPDWTMDSLPGMGALHSTSTDLARFLAAQLDPESTPLGDAIRRTHEPRTRLGRVGHVGLGWMLTPLPRTDRLMLWHNGGTGGAFSFVGLVPDARAGVAVLTNTARPVDRPAVSLLGRLVDGRPRG